MILGSHGLPGELRETESRKNHMVLAEYRSNTSVARFISPDLKGCQNQDH
jgi:hypothetical protein